MHPMYRTLLYTSLAVSACTSSARGAGERLTPTALRISDEAFASDLAVFDALHQRVTAALKSATGGRRYLAARAGEWVTLAREAYERNDRSAFPEDLIVLAERDLALLESGSDAKSAMQSSVLFPNDVRLFDDAAWGRALALRADADIVGAPDEIARAEGVLLRQGNHILAGPVCRDDNAAAVEAVAILRAVEQTRVTVVPTPAEPPPPPADTLKQEVTPRPAPMPQPDSTPIPKVLPREGRAGPCGAPERLTGVARNVHFALDKSYLSAASQRVLDQTLDRLREFPTVRIRLSGHTDPRASRAYNQALSERRVASVMRYLKARGLDSVRVVLAESRGEDALLTEGVNGREQARNRRVDIVYLLCDGSELVPEETVDDLQVERVRRNAKR